MKTLLEMKPGEDGRVIDVCAGQYPIEQFYQAGIVPGIKILLLARYPLQGPVVVKIGNHRLAIDRQLASLVQVEPDDDGSKQTR